MNINRIQNNIPIKNHAVAKPNSAEKPNFEAVLKANKAKGTNLSEIFEEASHTHSVPTNTCSCCKSGVKL